MFINCKTCDKEFSAFPYQNRKYCSHHCQPHPKGYKRPDIIGNSFAKGYRHTEEARRKISDAERGEKHHRWINDRSKLKRDSTHGERRNHAYKFWRTQVWLRDSFKCKIANQDCSGKIEAHHILSWRDYPELRYQINNGITLCHFHHPRKRVDEEKLSPYFQSLVAKMN